jgi:hypothetical protein
MLPASPPRGHGFAGVLGLLPSVVTIPIVALVLLISLGLGGCSGRGQPAASVVQSALALQIELTQSAIAEALQLKTPGAPEVSHVRVASTDSVRIGEGRGVHLTGDFDWRLAGDPVRVDSPFDIYLQRGERGQSWRLARPQVSEPGSGQAWITDPLPV